jgi:predicted N-acetyltransferase YhbS
LEFGFKRRDENMVIRQKKETEFPVIYDLVKVAFQTAKVSNGDEQNFVDRLRASSNYIPELALVAADQGELIGHIMLTKTFVNTENGQYPVLLLGPVSVVLERRNQGVGTRLIEEACRLARAQGHQAVILVGDPAYYHRFGFRSAVDFGIANTNGIPDEKVMACELTPEALRNVKGTITFQI